MISRLCPHAGPQDGSHFCRHLCSDSCRRLRFGDPGDSKIDDHTHNQHPHPTPTHAPTPTPTSIPLTTPTPRHPHGHGHRGGSQQPRMTAKTHSSTGSRRGQSPEEGTAEMCTLWSAAALRALTKLMVSASTDVVGLWQRALTDLVVHPECVL